MANEFRATSLQLFRVVGYPENVGRSQFEDDEPYHVQMAVEALENHVQRVLGKSKYANEAWPLNARTLDALRAALDDNRGNYAAKYLARALVRGASREPDVMASLDGWDRLMFTWNQEDLTAERAADELQRSGLGALVTEDIDALRGWLRNPLSAVDKAWDVATALFGDSLVLAWRKDLEEDAGHDKMLGDLFAKAKPAVEVANLEQTVNVPERFVPFPSEEDPRRQAMFKGAPVYIDAADHFIVSFSHHGESHQFTVKNGGKWMDWDGVMRYFDYFMANLGRSERVYDLQVDPWLGGFIVARVESAEHVVRQLHIPMRSCAR